jgi:hypothetical protein
MSDARRGRRTSHNRRFHLRCQLFDRRVRRESWPATSETSTAAVSARCDVIKIDGRSNAGRSVARWYFLSRCRRDAVRNKHVRLYAAVSAIKFALCLRV